MAKKEKITLLNSPDFEVIDNELSAAMQALDDRILQVDEVLKSFDANGIGVTLSTSDTPAAELDSVEADTTSAPAAETPTEETPPATE